MKLYITPNSPYARIARIMVLEKGLEDKVETIVAQTRQADSPYYTINPSGRVPYLVLDDGTAFEDSAVICHYFDHLEGAPAFDPPPDESGWQWRRLEASARSLLDGIAVWGRELSRPEDERSPTILAHEAARSRRMADYWEAQIAEPLMNGDLNIPQIVLICALQMERRNPAFGWRPLHPGLADWVGRLADRLSIARTIPPKQA
ncbi:MAG: glutathione S-transferase N-terminal domain-containing protein [Pseudomonadota bacterium]